MNWKRILIPIALLCVVGQTHTETPTPDPNPHCLAEAIYQEARGESIQGQMAVKQVVLNRVQHPHFPKNICEVVFQRGQFSWTAGWKTWTYTPVTLQLALDTTTTNLKALYFHSTNINPNWNKTYITTIGNHRFYK